MNMYFLLLEDFKVKFWLFCQYFLNLLLSLEIGLFPKLKVKDKFIL